MTRNQMMRHLTNIYLDFDKRVQQERKAGEATVDVLARNPVLMGELLMYNKIIGVLVFTE